MIDGSFFSTDELCIMKIHMKEAMECAEIGRLKKQVVISNPFINTLFQCNVIFTVVENCEMKNSSVFHNITQNIGCGYSIELPQRLCFGAK